MATPKQRSNAALMLAEVRSALAEGTASLGHHCELDFVRGFAWACDDWDIYQQVNRMAIRLACRLDNRAID